MSTLRGGLGAAVMLVVALTASIASAAAPTTTAATSNPAPAVVAPPAKEVFHIYLLMGQSNMVGRDTRTVAAAGADEPRVLALTEDGKWVVAHEPLHARVGRIPPGVGRGMSFAREMLEADPRIVIGLVPCAVGGTASKRWVKGDDLYEAAVARGKRAAATGTQRRSPRRASDPGDADSAAGPRGVADHPRGLIHPLTFSLARSRERAGAVAQWPSRSPLGGGGTRPEA